MQYCCNSPSNLEDRFDKNHNSVSDVLVTCLAYVSWLVWRSMVGKHDKNVLNTASYITSFMCMMAICQATRHDFPTTAQRFVTTAATTAA